VSVVIDASIVMKWIFEDEADETADRIMMQVSREGAIVPSLWRLEVANVLRMSVRRGRCDEAYADRSLERLRQLPIAVDAETDAHAWGRTLELARDCYLTLYDAAYLELALRKALPLATCDGDLVAAARKKQIPLPTML
jgi:predicted nucleic acid-binding protein